MKKILITIVEVISLGVNALLLLGNQNSIESLWIVSYHSDRIAEGSLSPSE